MLKAIGIHLVNSPCLWTTLQLAIYRSCIHFIHDCVKWLLKLECIYVIFMHINKTHITKKMQFFSANIRLQLTHDKVQAAQNASVIYLFSSWLTNATICTVSCKLRAQSQQLHLLNQSLAEFIIKSWKIFWLADKKNTETNTHISVQLPQLLSTAN